MLKHVRNGSAKNRETGQYMYAARQEIVACNNNTMLNPIIKKMQSGGLHMVSFHAIISCLTTYQTVQ